MKAVVEAVLSRSSALAIREISGSFKIIVHPNRDPGTFLTAQHELTSQTDQFNFALVMCDHHGSGSNLSREKMERDMEARLAASGWAGRSAAVVIEPELEAWVWQKSLHVATGLRWKGDFSDLYQWLTAEGYQMDGAKPLKPKAALDAALRRARTPKSASVFEQIASKASLRHCTDPAFVKLRRTLQSWFPIE